jgi:hypothetical protein
VFPGYTLTIEPGVTVKFDSAMQLELRFAALIAVGTITDSITFTSNTAQAAGSWANIYMNSGTMTSVFNYCNFSYATYALTGSTDSIRVKNSVFSFNVAGMHGGASNSIMIDSCRFLYNTSRGASAFNSAINYCTFSNNGNGLNDVIFSSIYNCTFTGNDTGFIGINMNTLYNCTFSNNQTGISCGKECRVQSCIINNNQSGIVTIDNIHDEGGLIQNNVIDSNAVVGIIVANRDDSVINNEIKYNGVGMMAGNSDSIFPNIITQNHIENNLTGLQLAYTYDSIFCNKICNNTLYDVEYTGVNNLSIPNNYFCTADSASTEVVIYDGYDNASFGIIYFMPMDTMQCYLITATPAYENQTSSFNIFPNPATGYLTVELKTINSETEIKIFNAIAEIVYSSTMKKQKAGIDISKLARGVYTIQITTEGSISRQKFIKQ